MRARIELKSPSVWLGLYNQGIKQANSNQCIAVAVRQAPLKQRRLRDMRDSRTLHLAVDTYTHEIIAASVCLSNVSDGEALPNLLRQTRRRIVEISGDGAYDTRLCYEAILIKRAAPFIPPREDAAFWERGHPSNLAVGC